MQGRQLIAPHCHGLARVMQQPPAQPPSPVLRLCANLPDASTLDRLPPEIYASLKDSEGGCNVAATLAHAAIFSIPSALGGWQCDENGLWSPGRILVVVVGKV